MNTAAQSSDKKYNLFYQSNKINKASISLEDAKNQQSLNLINYGYFAEIVEDVVNTIPSIPGTIENFSQKYETGRCQLYSFKNHKVLWIEESNGVYWVKQVWDMARGKKCSRATMETAARIIREKLNLQSFVLPF